MCAMEKEMDLVDETIVKVEEGISLSLEDVRVPSDNEEASETKSIGSALDMTKENTDESNLVIDSIMITEGSQERTDNPIDLDTRRTAHDPLVGGQPHQEQKRIQSAKQSENNDVSKVATEEEPRKLKRAVAAVPATAKRSRSNSRLSDTREYYRIPMENQKSLREFYERGGRDYNEYLHWLKTVQTFQESSVYSYEESRRDVGSPQIYTTSDRFRPPKHLMNLLNGCPDEAMLGTQHGGTSSTSPDPITPNGQSNIPSLEFIDDRNFAVLDLSRRKEPPPMPASKRLQELLLSRPNVDSTRQQQNGNAFDAESNIVPEERRMVPEHCGSTSPELNRTDNGRQSPSSHSSVPAKGVEFRRPLPGRSMRTNGEVSREYSDRPMYKLKSSVEAISPRMRSYHNGDIQSVVNTYTVHHQPSTQTPTHNAFRGMNPQKITGTEKQKEARSKSGEQTSVWPFLEEIIVRSLARSPPCRSIKDVTSGKLSRPACKTRRDSQGDIVVTDLDTKIQGKNRPLENGPPHSKNILVESPELTIQGQREHHFAKSPSPSTDPPNGTGRVSPPRTTSSVPSSNECSSANDADLLSWDVDQVVRFVTNIPKCQDYAEVFGAQEIDGLALSQLNEDHLVRFFSMKLGPAIRLKLAVVAKLKDVQR